MTVDASGDLDDLGAEAAATAHRIVQESMTNSLRHAPGSAIRIDLHCGPPVALTINNEPAPVDDRIDPKGAAVQPLRLSGSGRGLAGIMEGDGIGRRGHLGRNGIRRMAGGGPIPRLSDCGRTQAI